MKKLLYIANVRMPTEKAYGIQISQMCGAFASNSLEVTLAYPYRINPVSQNIFEYYGVNKNFKVEVCNAPDFYWPGALDKAVTAVKNFFSAVALVRRALKEDFDYYFSRDELPVFLLSFFRKNIVFEAHKFSASRSIFYRRFLKAQIKIVVISQGLKEEFVNFGFDPSQVLVAVDGVDLNKFDIHTTQDEARTQLGLPLGETLVGYVGALTTMGMSKGLDILFEAMKLLENATLVVVGSSVRQVDRIFYEKLAAQLGISERIKFVGQASYSLVPLYLKSFDVLAAPFPNSKHYSRYMSPLKLFEYMASDRPIVASDLPSIREILNAQNSVLVKPDSAQDLYEGLKFISENSEKGQSLAHQALKDVQNYTWKKRAERIIFYADHEKTAHNPPVL